MKNLILMMAVMSFVSLASADDKSMPMDKEHHMQMHEQMAKAHQQAADCLKAGKPEEECRAAFHKMCDEASGTGHCGEGMMHDHMKHKKSSSGT